MRNKNNYPIFLYGILLILLLNALKTSAQSNWYQFIKPLSFDEVSPYEYMYRIPADSVYKICFLRAPVDAAATWLQQPAFVVRRGRVDSLLQTGIPTGYYYIVNAAGNRVNTYFRYKQSFSANTENLRDIQVLVLRDTNKTIIQADVSVAGKPVAYDSVMRGYILHFKNKEKITVRRGEEIQFFDCGKIRNRVYKDRQRYDNYDRGYTPPPVFNGYLVTNKPKYLPGDTVKYKAYLLYPRTGDEANERVRVKLYESGGYNGQPSPYNHNFVVKDSMHYAEPGVYYSEFVLGDSVKPDRFYSLQMEGMKSGNTIWQQFKVEDYLLDQTFLRVTGEDLRMYQYGDSVKLYAYAYNSNSLPVSDGKIRITVCPRVSRLKHDARLFVPDTLIDRTTDVSATGETDVSFDTKSLPDAEMTLHCTVSLTNANFERKDTSFDILLSALPNYIRVTQQGQQIKAELIVNKKPVSGKGSYSSDHSREHDIRFPFTDTMREGDSYYSFTSRNDTGGIADDYFHTLDAQRLQGYTDFRRDTAYVELHNPRRFFVRYTVYIGNRYAGCGVLSNDTLMSIYSRKGKTVTVLAQYYANGNEMTERYEAALPNRKMLITLNKKDVVYPGQKDTIGINLSDAAGKGLKHTNMTVLAFNSEFKEDYTPDLPDNSILQAGVGIAKYNYSVTQQNFSVYGPSEPANLHLLKQCGADTMFFYKHLLFNPANVAWYLFGIDSGVAQLGIYLHRSGTFVTPEAVYVDGDLRYIRNTASPGNAHTFFAGEGEHTIRLRLNNSYVTVNYVTVCAAMKTNLIINIDSIRSLNGDTLHPFIDVQPMPDTLMNYEKDDLARHLLLYRQEAPDPSVFIQGMHQYAVDRGYQNYNNSYYANGRYYAERYQTGGSPVLLGPLNMNDSISFFQYRNVKMRFMPELHQIFSFRPLMTRVEKQNVYDYLGYHLGANEYWPANNDFNDTVRLPDNYDSMHVYIAPANVKHVYGRERRYVIGTTGSNCKGEPAGGLWFMNHTNQGVEYFVLKNKDASCRPLIWQNNGNFNDRVPVGSYEAWFIWQNGTYTVLKDIKVHTGGTLIVPVSTGADTFRYAAAPGWLLPHITFTYDSLPGVVFRFGRGNKIAKDAHYSTYNAGAGTSGITGTVTDEKHETVIGAVIELKQGGITRGGGITDADGSYMIKPLNPGRYDVWVMMNAYKTTLINGVIISPDKVTGLNVKLESDVKNMKEVVITSYKVPLIDRYQTGGDRRITSEEIEKMPSRSTNEVATTSSYAYSEAASPLPSISGGRSDAAKYIVDGVQVYNSRGINLAQRSIEEVEAVEDKTPGSKRFRTSAAAQQHMADFLNNMMAASGMRKNFRDWAIWEPDLWTDKEGNVRFKVTYPDNNTSWKTYVLAMNEKGFSGRMLTLTRAYKPLSAQLSMPRFLRYGDTAEVVGKVINYTPQPFDVTTTFTRNSVVQTTDTLFVHNARVQRPVTYAPTTNSVDTAQLTLSYGMNTAGGYTDGEERTIPVYPAGTVDSKGSFVTMFHDTVIGVNPSDTDGYFTGKTRIYVNGSLLEVMLNEIENLKEYPYGCNEQLTTKLLAIYYEEEVKHLIGNDSLNNKDVKKEILDKLIHAQNKNGSFGWWYNGDADYRITNYIISTMHKINKDGWLDYIIRRGLQHLNDNLDNMAQYNLISSLSTLSAANYAANYMRYTDTLSKHYLNDHDLAVIIKIRKEQKLPYRNLLDSLIKDVHRTYYGTYLGEEGYDWYRNATASTLLLYGLVKEDSVYGYMKDDVMKYILFKRRYGYYANTAESGQVLTTLLPDLLNEKGISTKTRTTQVVVGGSIKDTVRQFPVTYALNDKKAHFTFAKSGISPVFVSVVYDYLNLTPVAYGNTFKVNTVFLNNRDTVTYLKQGEKAVLRTTVTCDKETEYVMIEVPIPAGTLQADKNGYHPYPEVNRENYKDKTVIFCNSLGKGTYTFDVTLECRYKGNYVVNPAKAQMMYYPNEYGNTAIKKVKIN